MATRASMQKGSNYFSISIALRAFFAFFTQYQRLPCIVQHILLAGHNLVTLLVVIFNWEIFN